MASSFVGGLSDAFIPVSEDQGMIDVVNRFSCSDFVNRGGRISATIHSFKN